jgi:hypothetical protein
MKVFYIFMTIREISSILFVGSAYSASAPSMLALSSSRNKSAPLSRPE